MAHVRKVFETNTFGVMAMTQAVIPQFRARQIGRRGQRDLQRDAGADAAGGGLHRQQDGHRRVHRIAGPRAPGLRRARQAGRARLRSDHALCRRTRQVRIEDLIPEAYASFAQPIFAAFATAGPGDHGGGRGRGGVAGCQRYVRAAPISRQVPMPWRWLRRGDGRWRRPARHAAARRQLF